MKIIYNAVERRGIMICFSAIYHEAKSQYAYAYDYETIHLRLRTAKNDVDQVKVIYGDPFLWGPREMPDHTGNHYEWKHNGEPEPMVKEYSTELHDYYFIAIKPPFRRVKYAFIVEKGNARYLYGCREIVKLNDHPNKLTDLFNFFNFPFINPIDVYRTPDWAKDTIWYQIFPERFHNGNPDNDPDGVLPWGSVESVSNHHRFGGDLEGVIQKLDYIQTLGCNGIYFTPIFKSPSTHKYDTEDYFTIDPQFGDIETLKRLVQEAHKRGIRIMLDAVFNHSGYTHPFFQDVIKHGEQSKYKDYYHIRRFPVLEDLDNIPYENGQPKLNFDTFAFTYHMPKWNTENAEVKKYLLDVATFWIRTCDIDAWRLDVSNEVDHHFWREFRKACDEAKKDFFIVGENWDDSNPWLRGDQFHSVMNYEFLFPMVRFFAERSEPATRFMYRINKVLTQYPKHVTQTLFNLLDSHDTARFLTLAGDDTRRLKLATVFQFTYPGSPSIYYGDEIGLKGKHDPDNRRCMIWDEEKQNRDLFKHYQKLIALRKKHPSFKAVDIHWIEANDETNHLIYQKQAEGETITVIINNNDQPLMIQSGLTLHHRYKDLYSEEIVPFTGSFLLEAYGFRIFLHLDE